ncbi:AN1-type zinc finger domain-containing protein [Methanocella conradii]|uniref:AN1-type zinc finger domain-containing protein n=1 Tax=Methanocella conradii TaxID=1175444 RepID=UPI00157DA942|nr:AN1-type zinc finger protein [Methanocella conradii]
MEAKNKCDICGEYELLPFKCKYCGGTFCGEHRLPEKHDCTGLAILKSPSYAYKNEQIARFNSRYIKKRKRSNPVQRLVKIRNFVYLGLAIIFILIIGIGYTTYTKYQPLIDDYNAKINSMNNAYSMVEHYTDTYYSSSDFLSDEWLAGLKNSIDNYKTLGEEAISAGYLIQDCPYYDKNILYENERAFNSSLKRAMEYYNAPTHTLQLWDDKKGAIMVYPNGSRCHITEHRDAKDPTYAQLISFLLNDHTELDTYIPGSYVCENFAIRLHDNAESNLIRAHLVNVEFYGQSSGHMIVAFNTVDRGTVYIDDTGNTIEQKMRGCPSLDAYVNPAVGQEYIPQYLFPGLAGGWYHTSMGRVSDVYQIS